MVESPNTPNSSSRPALNPLHGYRPPTALLVSLTAVVLLHYLTAPVPALHYASVVLALTLGLLLGSHMPWWQASGLGSAAALVLLSDAAWLGAIRHEVHAEIVGVGAVFLLPIVASGRAHIKRRRLGLFGGYYWSYAAKTTMGRYITELEAAFLEEIVARLSQPPSLIIDAGAGDGRFSRMLAELADRVIATEVDDGLVHALDRISSRVLPVLVSPASNRLPAQDNSADCVVCIEVPDLADHDWFLAESHRVLRPGGILIVTLQNRHSWKGIRVSPARHRYTTKSGGRYYAYSCREMTARLSRAGFRREEGLGFNWLPFTRASDNPLVPLFAKLEALLQLRRLVSVSPWVILAARKDA